MVFKNKINSELKLKNKVYRFENDCSFGVTENSKKDVKLDAKVSLYVDSFVKNFNDVKKDFYKFIFNNDTMYHIGLNFKLYKDKKGSYKYNFETRVGSFPSTTSKDAMHYVQSLEFKAVKNETMENLCNLGGAIYYNFDGYTSKLYPHFVDEDTKICAAIYFATMDHDQDHKTAKIIEFEDLKSMKFTLGGKVHSLKDWIAEPYNSSDGNGYANDNPHDHIGLFVHFDSYNKKHYIDNPKSCKFKPTIHDKDCIFVLHKPKD